ncbi:TPA: hypothetical protein H2W97_004057 [Salmonella enterica]|jgi:hypothetical protein|uniref:hypothetical protein n=1 Tax=Enterobacteriaceae TaxID=543 RepID=UPI000DF10761|nr:hypothetical protein [Citrobacter koseri]EJR7830554.1 hypothetical protein [Salmonella enterica subsp. enterica serovar Orion]HAK7474988.1 hypothetical protein [Salmonella enterica]EJR7832879.1 hypothetical protein [Salmonella enterica subsp. enterica serovar Orion]STB73719.1 Uncharacterised protein [Citrobacter koseri]HAK8236163.1 hypothetical protein [Salmonella enterica]
MKKLLLAPLLCVPSLAMAIQPVSDTEATNQLRLMNSQLELIAGTLASNQQKIFTCTDGEKTYTVGLDITRGASQYRCILKGDHAEWERQPRLSLK